MNQPSPPLQPHHCLSLILGFNGGDNLMLAMCISTSMAISETFLLMFSGNTFSSSDGGSKAANWECSRSAFMKCPIRASILCLMTSWSPCRKRKKTSGEVQGWILWCGQWEEEEEEEAKASGPWSRICLYWRFRAEHATRASEPKLLSLGGKHKKYEK